jgi:hypothetical protein
MITPISYADYRSRRIDAILKSESHTMAVSLSIENLRNIQRFTIESHSDDLDWFKIIIYDHEDLIYATSISSYEELPNSVDVGYPHVSLDCLLAMKMFIDEFGIKNEQIQWIHPDLQVAFLKELGDPDLPNLIIHK